jgi:hypothetical protein
MKGKPEGWEDSLKDMINSGKNWKLCNKELKELYGEEGALGGSTFRRHKKDLTGGKDVDNDLEALAELKKGEKPEKPPRPAWTKQKQSAADTSKLAQIINKGMYAGLMPFCANKNLQEKDVQEINLGGAVVGTVQYLVPGVNLDHPLVLLATRGIILYLKFKAICGKIEQIKAHIDESIGGIKQGWTKEEH